MIILIIKGLRDIISGINDEYYDERMKLLDKYEDEFVHLHQVNDQESYDSEIRELFSKIIKKTHYFNFPAVLPLVLRDGKNDEVIKDYFTNNYGSEIKIIRLIKESYLRMNTGRDFNDSILDEYVNKEYKFDDEIDYHLKIISTLSWEFRSFNMLSDMVIYVFKKHDKHWTYQIRGEEGEIIYNLPYSKDSPRLLATKPKNPFFTAAVAKYMRNDNKQNNILALQETFFKIQDKIDELNIKPDFSVTPNPIFIKEDKKIKQFLEKSHKVYLNPDLFFTAFKLKDKIIRLLCVDNKSEQVEEYQILTLTHLNKQSNLRYVIETELLEEHLEIIEQFQRYFLNTLKDHLLDNKKIFYEIFKSKSDFYKATELKIINQL